MTDQPRTPTDLALDAFIYAPLGLLLEVGDLLPRLAERGRDRYGTQVTTARLLGRLAVQQGCRELERRRQAARDPAEPSPAPGPSPVPAAAVADDPTGTSEAASPSLWAHAAPPADPVVTAPGPAPLHDDAPQPPPGSDDLGIPDYDSLAASQVVPRLAGLRSDELEAVRRYEAAHRSRRTILTRVAQLQAAS